MENIISIPLAGALDASDISIANFDTSAFASATNSQTSTVTGTGTSSFIIVFIVV